MTDTPSQPLVEWLIGVGLAVLGIVASALTWAGSYLLLLLRRLEDRISIVAGDAEQRTKEGVQRVDERLTRELADHDSRLAEEVKRAHAATTELWDALGKQSDKLDKLTSAQHTNHLALMQQLNNLTVSMARVEGSLTIGKPASVEHQHNRSV